MVSSNRVHNADPILIRDSKFETEFLAGDRQRRPPLDLTAPVRKPEYVK